MWNSDFLWLSEVVSLNGHFCIKPQTLKFRLFGLKTDLSNNVYLCKDQWNARYPQTKDLKSDQSFKILQFVHLEVVCLHAMLLKGAIQKLVLICNGLVINWLFVCFSFYLHSLLYLSNYLHIYLFIYQSISISPQRMFVLNGDYTQSGVNGKQVYESY